MVWQSSKLEISSCMTFVLLLQFPSEKEELSLWQFRVKSITTPPPTYTSYLLWPLCCSSQILRMLLPQACTLATLPYPGYSRPNICTAGSWFPSGCLLPVRKNSLTTCMKSTPPPSLPHSPTLLAHLASFSSTVLLSLYLFTCLLLVSYIKM